MYSSPARSRTARPVAASVPTSSTRGVRPSARRTTGTAPASTKAALVTTMPSSRTTMPDPCLGARRLDPDHRGGSALPHRVGRPADGRVEGGHGRIEGDTLGDRALDHALADLRARPRRPPRGPPPPCPRPPPRPTDARAGGRHRGGDLRRRRARPRVVDRCDRVGAHLGGVAPEPIVRVRRRTEARVVRFGVVVEGHVARLTAAARPRGAGCGARLPYDEPDGLDRRARSLPRGRRGWASTSAPLPVAEAVAWAVRPDCGGLVLFSGTARDHAAGRPGVAAPRVRGLRGRRSCRGSTRWPTRPGSRWPVLGRIVLLHRTGVLEVGEAAVVVVVSAPHRGEAFDAARFCIDTLKAFGADLEARDLGRRRELGPRSAAHRRRRKGPMSRSSSS